MEKISCVKREVETGHGVSVPRGASSENTFYILVLRWKLQFSETSQQEGMTNMHKSL